MNEPLEMLLLRLEAGTASAEDMAELERVMATPEGRKQVVNHLMLNAALSEVLATGLHKSSSVSARREVERFHQEHETPPPLSTRVSAPRRTRKGALRPFARALSMATLLALVAGALFFFTRTTPQTHSASVAIVEQLFGDVAETSSARRTVSVGAELLEGQSLETGINSFATLVFADGSTLRLHPNTRLEALSIAKGKQALLSRGKIQAEVKKQPPETPMVLRTVQATVTVLGTEFSLDAIADATRLEVESGKVRIVRARDSAVAEVSTQQFAVAGTAIELIAKPLDPPAVVARTIQLNPVADTYVRAGREARNNFGKESIVGVKHDDGRHEREALLRFDLSSIKGRITQARLRLHVFSMDSQERYTHSLALLEKVTWQENTVTWNDRPTGGTLLATWTPQPSSFVTVDLTPALQPGLLQLKQWDFRIFAPNLESGNSWCFYSARETKNPPVLVLTVVDE